MEGLEFYDHGTRVHYGNTKQNIISTVHVFTGSASIAQVGSKLCLNLKSYLGPESTLEFNMKGDRWLEMEYIELEDLIFFSSNVEYILFKEANVFAHKSWPSKVSSVKLGPGLKLAICYENHSITSCSLDAVNGKLVNIFESNLDAEPENVPVAWGSRSKNYKRAIRERASNYVAEGGPTIAWAADGDHFVVNAFKNENRIILVFSKSCNLLYKSEPGMFPGLEIPIAFQPDSALIGCILSEKGSDQELILIQKNLEILYSLKLEDDVKVQKLLWSNCSEVLAVWQKSDSKSWLDLYMISNTKFYLKQRLPFTNVEELLNFKFSESMESSYIIQFIFKNYLFQYSFVKKLTKSDCFGGDKNLTCEIDGKSMDLYVYTRGILPPRSCQPHFTLRFDDCISTVVFDSFRCRFAVIDIAYNVIIYKYSESDCEKISKFTLDINEIVLPLTYYRYFFEPNGSFGAVRLGKSNSDFSTDTMYFYSESDSTFLKKICNTRILKGQRVIYGLDEQNHETPLRYVPVNNAPITDYIIFKYKYEYSVTKYCFGRIDVNDTRVNGIFTSIHFTNTHILLTCKRDDFDIVNDYLLALELNENTLQCLIHGSGSIFDIAYSRPIEKGAIILNDVPKTAMIVLLLPRGNTECIHLRNMSLKALNEFLNSKDFESAYKLIKFESLGLNLLVDLNPPLFKRNLREIVLCLHELSALHKFIIELNDSTCLTPEDRKLFCPETMKNKRYVVCNMIINLILQFENPIEYLSVISIAALCCQPEGYNSVKTAEVISTVVGHEFSKYKSEIIKALKIVNPYISYEIQYSAALQVFNLDLAELVAERSEMDPQQYRPFLTKLKSLSDLHCRQSVSSFLGKTRESAMYYLEMFDEKEVSYDDLLTFTEQNNCFELYYHEFNIRGSVPKEIASKYSLQLEKQQKYKQAGLVISSNNMYLEAVSLFMKGLFWEEAISALYNIPNITAEQKKEQLIFVAKQLETSNRFKDAGDVYLNFLDDPRSAADSYMKGFHFKDAYLILMKINKQAIDKVLIPNMKDAMKNSLLSLREIQEKYNDLFNRLKILRETKMSIEIYEENAPDYFSEAGSVRTKSTRSTSSKTSSKASSKKKSKEEKKMTNAREGSKYEDIAIMHILYKSIEEGCGIISNLEEQTSLLDLITLKKEHAYTRLMLFKLDDFKKQMIDTSDEIWPEFLKRFDIKTQEEAGFINISELDLKYRSKPDVLKKLKFNVKNF